MCVLVLCYMLHITRLRGSKDGMFISIMLYLHLLPFVFFVTFSLTH